MDQLFQALAGVKEPMAGHVFPDFFSCWNHDAARCRHISSSSSSRQTCVIRMVLLPRIVVIIVEGVALVSIVGPGVVIVVLIGVVVGL